MSTLIAWRNAAHKRVLVASDQPLPVAPASLFAVQGGNVFMAGTSRRSLGLAGHFRATVQNPAGSGRNLVLARLMVFSTVNTWARLFINPTSGLPTAEPRPVTNVVVGHPNAAVAVLRVDTSSITALGGGTDTGMDVGVGAGDRAVVELPPLIIPPGVVLGVNSPVSAAADATFNLVWQEVAA